MGCGEAACGVLWVPTCDQTCSTPTGETHSYASATMEDLALDILGPLPSGKNLLVLVDYHSRWIEVAVVRETTSKIIIQRLYAQFARYGIPKSLRTGMAQI